ncbi:MAG: amidoligase family protein, partial [bacterium]
MKTLRFGIEIETVGLGRQDLARAIHSVVGGDLPPWGTSVTDPSGRVWRVESDGSLSSGNSGEIVSPILTYDDLDLLQAVVRAVARAGARADYSTGIHIHIDGSQFDVRSLLNLVNFVHKQERLLEHVLQITSRRLGQYCKPIDPEFMARLARRKPTTMEALNRA